VSKRLPSLTSENGKEKTEIKIRDKKRIEIRRFGEGGERKNVPKKKAVRRKRGPKSREEQFLWTKEGGPPSSPAFETGDQEGAGGEGGRGKS